MAMCVYSDGRESHVVTKKFDVRQIETDIKSRNDDDIDFGRNVSVSEVKPCNLFVAIVTQNCV